jgi:hypoxanthine-DNA glycosylase
MEILVPDTRRSFVGFFFLSLSLFLSNFSQTISITLSAFWWIAGDCLGFRRDLAISPVTGKAYQFASELWYGPEYVLSYEDQVKTLVSKGFALWDVVHSCQRKGSLDQDIRNEQPNAIRLFCQQHPQIRRIVLANGQLACRLFRKHFEDWLLSEELAILDHPISQKAFASILKKKRQGAAAKDTVTREFNQGQPITVICALSVSPAAASLTYATKRAFWNEYVYQPGLADYRTIRDTSSTDA